MKRIVLAAVLSCILALTFTMTAFADDGQNPVMNFIGRYGENRATIDVSAEGDADAKIHVTWGSSAWQTAEWDMSGTFDEKTLTVTYDNCVKKVITFEDETSATEEVAYENGKGSFTFSEDGTLTWDDQEEHIADGTVFTYTNYTESENSVTKSEKLLGGWEIAEDQTITDEIRDLFQKGMELSQDETAKAYMPVSYLGHQLVAGLNHAILCKSPEGWAIVYLYQDLNDNVSVIKIDQLTLGI